MNPCYYIVSLSLVANPYLVVRLEAQTLFPEMNEALFMFTVFSAYTTDGSNVLLPSGGDYEYVVNDKINGNLGVQVVSRNATSIITRT